MARDEAYRKAEKQIAEAKRTGASSLNLSFMRLTEVPEALGQLTQLHTLYLNSNQLSSVPEALGQLTQLQELHLDSNQLLSVPESLGQLTQLYALDLSDNQLSSVPEVLGQLTKLQKLYLHENPDLGIPPEVLGPTWEEVLDDKTPADPKAILAYYFDSRGIGSRAMNEAKVLLVGQGRVGKSSLVRYLVHGKKCNKRETPTDGIARIPWKVKVAPPETRATVDVTLNVWDFGGQEIMHATHQFFLTKRSLYLLVLDAGTSEAENNLFYWLKLIKSFGDSAPVLVVVNKSEGDFPLALNESRLRTDYPNIHGFHYVSCCSGAGVPALKKAIAEQVRKLPHVFDPVPGSFFAVKRKIESWSGTRSYITLREYQALCVEATLTEHEPQNRLLRFLHDLGVALNFDDPEDPYELGDTNVLDPQWVTDAVYRVITSHTLNAARGVLQRADLPAILPDPARFPELTHGFVLDLMRKFELCFDFPDSSGERFLVPERLPKDEPDVGWLAEHDASALSFQVKYNVLPPGLVCRFIVKMNTHLTFPAAEIGRPIAPTYWRDGCVLRVHDNRCLVRGSVEDRRIYIQVQGTEGTRREALALIRDRLHEIHRTIKELKTDELVPVPGQPGVAVEYGTLIENLCENIDRFIPPGGRATSANGLVTRIETSARTHAAVRNARPKESRISLSTKDASRATGAPRVGIPSDPVDFGIITMKEEEYRAVERRFAPVTPISTAHRTYLRGQVETPHGPKTVYIARCLEQGHAAAQQCANEMLADLDPRWLLLVGIAGAFPSEDYTLGDVLLASRVHDFSVTAALKDGSAEFAGKGGPVHPDVAKLLAVLPGATVGAQLGEWNGPAMISMTKPNLTLPKTHNAKAFYGPPAWRLKVREALLANFPQGTPARGPRYRVESVVTGNVLTKNPALVKQWRLSARQAAHVEMELGGVYEAAQVKHKPVLSVRGLSDIVGFERSSAWTEFACQTAAAFARALVGSGLIEVS
ncbi:MAG TPA: COR domain-containing protein [Gemmata sp.]